MEDSAIWMMIVSIATVAVVLVLVPMVRHSQVVDGGGGGEAGKGGRAMRRRRPRPPSPRWEWPVLGHIHLLGRCMDMRFVEQMKKELGGVYGLRFGKVRNIYVADADLVQEALVKKGAMFWRRPQPEELGVVNANFRDINSSNDEYWRKTRRNLVKKVLSAANLRSFSATFLRRYFHDILPNFFHSQQKSSKVVFFHETCTHALSCVSASLCFGFPFHGHNDELHQLLPALHTCASLFLPLFLSHLYPFLRPFLFPNLFHHLSSATQIRDRIPLSLIHRHRQATASASSADFFPGSYVETLLPLTEQSTSTDDDPPLSMTDVVALCAEFMEASVSTTATTVEWAMAHLVKDPTLQEKLYRHIRDVVGDRPMEEEDLPKLPYLRAVVMETLRLHPPGHFILPYAASEACELGGYEIGTRDVIYVCAAAVTRDPEIWDEPMEFRPDRMLSAEMDVTEMKRKMGTIPFGAGRRICPGMGLGQMLAEMFVGRLVQDFEWLTLSSPHNPHDVDLVSERLEFTVRMANPLQARIKARHNNNNNMDALPHE